MYKRKERTAWDFYGERVIRIVPLYWIATLSIMALFGLGFRPSGLQDYDMADVGASFLFYPHVRLDGESAPILSLGWTLTYEMFFYLVFGALLWMRSTRDRVVALSTFFAIVVGIGWLLGSELPYVLRVYTNPIVLEFIIGCWIGYWYLSEPKKRRIPIVAAFLAAGLMMLIVDYYFRVSPDNYRVLTYGFPAVLIVVGAFLAEISGAKTRNSTALLVGAASYSIYLFHPLLLQPFVNMAAKVITPTPTMGYVMMPFAALAAVTVAVGIHLGLEAPLTRWLRNVWGRERARVLPETGPSISK